MAVPFDSSALTAPVTVVPGANHSSETSSCVGPMGSNVGPNGGGGFGGSVFVGVSGFSGEPFGLPGGKELGEGRKVLITSAGVVVIPLLGSSLKRLGSMGDWPCLAVMMISVDASSPCAFSVLTISPMLASTNLISPCSGSLGVPAASRYPPLTPDSISFCPTLTAWKFMPKIVGTGAV